MNTEEIIEMARQAGFTIDGDSWIHAGKVMIDGRKSIDHLLEAFAKLVDAKATAREREDAIRIAEFHARMNVSSLGIADALRNRGDL